MNESNSDLALIVNVVYGVQFAAMCMNAGVASTPNSGVPEPAPPPEGATNAGGGRTFEKSGTGAADDGCFVAGTTVLTESGDESIEHLHVGEHVWSQNVDTQATELSTVTKVFVHHVTNLLDLRINGEVIETTAIHPFWVEGKDWTPAGELVPGDRVRTSDGTLLPIEQVDRRSGEFVVYNIEVDPNHNYFVSHSRVLVHNKPQKNSNPRSAAEQLDDLTGKTLDEARQELTDEGFVYQGTTAGGYEKWYHPDGSRVQIRPGGGVARSAPKCPSPATGKVYRPRIDQGGNVIGPGGSHDTGENVKMPPPTPPPAKTP
jgi:hypothetical protein